MWGGLDEAVRTSLDRRIGDGLLATICGNSKGVSCYQEPDVQNLLRPLECGQVDKRSSWSRKSVIR